MAKNKDKSDKPKRRIVPKWFSFPLLVIFVAIVWIVFLQDNNIFKSYENERKIAGLKEDIKQVKDSTEFFRKNLRELHSEREALEKVARERYQMKNENEDVFITDIK